MKKILAFALALSLLLPLAACGRKEEQSAAPTAEPVKAEEAQQEEDVSAKEPAAEEETPEEPAEEKAAEEEPAEEEPAQEGMDEIDPAFKEALDSYEEFFDSYIAFMERYADSDDALGMMAEYAEYMTKYADAMEKLDEMDKEDMTPAELGYYTEVMARISQKLAGASF